MTDACVTAYTGKETNGVLSVHVSQSAKTKTAHTGPPYNIAIGRGPATSVMQSGLTAPGARPDGTGLNMSSMTPGQARSALPHDPLQPLPVKPVAHDRVNQGSPTQQNPLSTDLKQIMQNLPSMTQPPPPIRNARPQQPLAQYIGTTQSGGHEVRSSQNTQLGAAFPIMQSLLDYRKSPVQHTSHSNHSQFSQQSQPLQTQHKTSSPQFPGQISNPALFHQQKQTVGQPLNPAPASPPMRPTLTSSRSAGNIPTVAETLFGEQGLAAARGINPLASIFSQQQSDNGKQK